MTDEMLKGKICKLKAEIAKGDADITANRITEYKKAHELSQDILNSVDEASSDLTKSSN